MVRRSGQDGVLPDATRYHFVLIKFISISSLNELIKMQGRVKILKIKTNSTWDRTYDLMNVSLVLFYLLKMKCHGKCPLVVVLLTWTL